jgi:RNA polymerase sigma-70 factor (ECF subfamily)
MELNKFEDIYKDNYKAMYCVAQKMVYDQDAAKDIVQDVFIYFYEKQKVRHEIRQLKNWLIRATINKCIDYSKQRKRNQSLDMMDTLSTTEIPFEKMETQFMVRKALSNLKPQERILAVLYSEGFSYKEMATLAEIKFSSIGKMLSRTLGKLKEQLKKQDCELY